MAKIQQNKVFRMNYRNFLKLQEKHYINMSSQKIGGRQSRRTYIEKVLDELGFTFVIETDINKIEGAEKEVTTSPTDDFEIETEDEGGFGLYDRRYEKKFQTKKKRKFIQAEFEKYCLDYWGALPKDMSKKERTEIFQDYCLITGCDDDYLEMNTPFVRSFYRPRNMKDNIAVFANGFDINRPTRILMAHYDVNTESDAHDNANDNGASVIVLLEYLEEGKFPQNKNIVIVFTDGEEFGGQGAESLSKTISEGIYGNVEWVLNLDVVGIGDILVFENIKGKLRDRIQNILGDQEMGFINMPPNDAMYMRSVGKVDAICLSVVPEMYWDINAKKLKSTPKIWSFIHSEADKWDTIQNSALAMVLDAVTKIMNNI
jgi:hypothetical protein